MEFDVKNNSIKSIQILRGIAAFMVAYLHSTGREGVNLLPSTGWFGVDIFFIISGFVIAFIITKDTKYFLLKRIFRIVPLYIIATLIMVLICTLFPEKINHAVSNLPAFIKSILFIPYRIETKFEPSGPILEQAWTLNYEVFFYLVMAVCISMVKNKKLIGMACTAVLIIIIWILNTINTNIFIIRYYQNNLFPEFIYGIVLFYVYNYFCNKKYIFIRSPIINITISGIIAIVSFVCLCGNILIKFNVNRNIYGGIPSLLFVASFLILENQIKNNRMTKFFLRLGEASYVLYLFHTFIITLFTRIIFVDIINHNENIAISLMLEMIIMLSTVMGSILLYDIIDKPIQNYLRAVLGKIMNKKTNMDRS
jgi:peptidoglycan/LPS O-acetylase OafA/YrhL